MSTIAAGEVENLFVPLAPKVTFGNSDPLLTAGPSLSGDNPVQSIGGVGSRSDVQTVADGGPIRNVTLNRDGSVVGSNAAGGQVALAVERRQELVPFNATPKPLSSVQPIAGPAKKLDSKTLGWIAGVLVAIGVYLLL